MKGFFKNKKLATLIGKLENNLKLENLQSFVGTKI